MTTSPDGHKGRAPSFSQRHGYKPFSEALQVETLNERTRRDIWNVLIYRQFVFNAHPNVAGETIWIAHLGEPLQDYTANRLGDILDKILTDGEWFAVYDLLEFLVQRYAYYKRDEYIKLVNAVLALNRSGYRVANEYIIPISSAEEVAAVDAAAQSPLENAAVHMKNAVQQFSARENANFAKSIDESMSAAEAAVNALAGTQGLTLGDALSALQKQGFLSFHPALLEGWKRLYGFTSDAGGIRHALKDGSVAPNQDLAQYFLISCSAFVNLAAGIQSETAT